MRALLLNAFGLPAQPLSAHPHSEVVQQALLSIGRDVGALCTADRAVAVRALAAALAGGRCPVWSSRGLRSRVCAPGQLEVAESLMGRTGCPGGVLVPPVTVRDWEWPVGRRVSGTQPCGRDRIAGPRSLCLVSLSWRLGRDRGCGCNRRGFHPHLVCDAGVAVDRRPRCCPRSAAPVAKLADAEWASRAEVLRRFSTDGGIVLGEITDPRGGDQFDPDDQETWGRQGKGRLIMLDPSRGSAHTLVFSGSGSYKTAGVVMNDVCRSDYIECMVASVLGPTGASHGRTAGIGCPGGTASTRRPVPGWKSGRPRQDSHGITNPPRSGGGRFSTSRRARLLAAGRRSMDRGAGPPCTPLRLCLA